MTRYGMALDTFTCIGCYSCTLACKVENGSPAGIWWAPVMEREIGTFPDVRRMYLPMLCNHCEDAPCIGACPTGAVSRRDDGIVLIDQTVCCGSRGCLIACPYGAIRYYDRPDPLVTPFEAAKVGRHQPGTAQKCTFCVDRRERGLEPACVIACPTGARIFGDLEDPDSPVAKALGSRDSVPLGTPVETAPAVRYLPEGVRHAGASEADIVLPYRRQRHWGLHHALEFWLLGAGAGLFAASRWLAIERTVLGLELGALLALLMVAAAGLTLVSDLGRPLRVMRALANWRNTWISRGATANLLFIAVAAVLALPVPEGIRLPATVLALALGAVVAVYPALVMGAMQSVPAWRGRRLALEFLVEALMCGVAVAGFLGGWSGPALPLLAVLAFLRLGLAAWHWRLTWMVGLGAGITGGLAVLALLVSPAVFGGAAAAAALLTSLLAKRLNIAAGTAPSPFGAGGELGGTADAEH